MCFFMSGSFNRVFLDSFYFLIPQFEKLSTPNPTFPVYRKCDSESLYQHEKFVTDDLDVLYNRARRQIIYPVDQLRGNAPSERIVTVKVSSCYILLLVFHVFYICCLQPNRWSLTISFYYVYTGTLFSDSFEQKTDLGTKGENLSHAIENTGNQKARNHSIFCGMQWEVF